jgi:hypothetical protein
MSYTKNDYLQGRTPPPPHELEEEDEVVTKTYCYGVKRSSKGRLHTFICLEKNFQKQRGVVTYETIVKDSERDPRLKSIASIAQDRSFEMLKAEKQKESKIKTTSSIKQIQSLIKKKALPSAKPKPEGIFPGSIVIHADGHGQHTAIVLIKEELDSVLLFVTSNPYWGKVVREMTRDEQILIGHSVKQKSSFFVRVNRSNKELLSTGSSFPKHRTTELKKEFCPWLKL